MFRPILPLVLGLAPLAACSAPPAEQATAPLADADWTLVPGESQLSFVTVKGGNTGEAHRFETLSGTVAKDGKASLTVDLASVDTGVDIRDQRMRDMLFEIGTYPQAVLTTSIDPASVRDLAVGAQLRQTVPATLDVHGTKVPLDADLDIVRIAPDKVLVETAKPLIVDAAAAGLGQGVEALRKVANLPEISTAVPVTASLVFTSAAPATP